MSTAEKVRRLRAESTALYAEVDQRVHLHQVWQAVEEDILGSYYPVDDTWINEIQV